MEKIAISFFIFFTLVGFALIFWAESSVENDWNAFVTEHNCKITQVMEGHSGIGYSFSGKPVYIPESDKTGWLCDDGITYWR